jgi:hypothetical protein
MPKPTVKKKRVDKQVSLKKAGVYITVVNFSQVSKKEQDVILKKFNNVISSIKRNRNYMSPHFTAQF